MNNDNDFQENVNDSDIINGKEQVKREWERENTRVLCRANNEERKKIIENSVPDAMEVKWNEIETDE